MWLRRKHSNYAHKVMRRNGSHVEFWCGHEGDDADLVLPTKKTLLHQACKEYAEHKGECKATADSAVAVRRAFIPRCSFCGNRDGTCAHHGSRY